VTGTGPPSRWERYAWAAGIVFVVALVGEAVVSVSGVRVNQNDSAATIAASLADHREQILVAAYLSVVYAGAFPIWLVKLHRLLSGSPDRTGVLGPLVLIGGTLFVALHAVSDVGIYALLGSKLASFGAQHDPGNSYTLYLMTFALDSVGDVFGSLFAIATGMLVIRSGALPRWLGWVAVVVGISFFLQGFTLGGVVATFGVGVDGLGFVLLLAFVMASSVVMLRRGDSAPGKTPHSTSPSAQL
jgi:hypothetical protein